jgi:putative chitinase
VRAHEINNSEPKLIQAFRDFLPIAVKELGLTSLPKIKLELRIEDSPQPTFGKYVNDEKTLYLAIEDRNVLDILRTFAHELVHYKQDTEQQLDYASGETGSNEENQGNALAGVLMRHFDKAYPEYFEDGVVDIVDEDWRNWVAGAGAASMLAGLGGAAYDNLKAPEQQIQQPTAQVQQVAKPQPKVQAPVAKQITQQQVDKAKEIMSTKEGQTLIKTAMASGIKGTELAQFIAQCAHETADFSTMKEFGGSLDFRKYDIKFNPAKAKQLGNLQPGDGAKYKGRGFIQLTGRYNYKKAGEALGLPLEKKPELVEKPEVAAKVAVWFWKNRVQPQVNNFADTTQATKPINPGLKHLDQRHEKFAATKVAMNKPTAKVKKA